MTTISCIDGIYRLSVKYGTQPATQVVLHTTPANMEDDSPEMDYHHGYACRVAEERFPELAPFVIG